MKFLATFGFGLLLLAGCSTKPQTDYSKADLVEVTGTVTLDGEPLSFAVVSFDSPDDQFSYAMTDTDGIYRLQFDVKQTGCTKGPKVVQVSTNRTILGLNIADDGAAEDEEGDLIGDAKTGSGVERVPSCYNRESKLKVTVTDADTTFDFDLKSDCS